MIWQGKEGELRIYEYGNSGTSYYLQVLFCEMDLAMPIKRPRTEETLMMDRGMMDDNAHYTQSNQYSMKEPMPISFSCRLADTVNTRALSDWLSGATKIPKESGGATQIYGFDGSGNIFSGDQILNGGFGGGVTNWAESGVTLTIVESGSGSGSTVSKKCLRIDGKESFYTDTPITVAPGGKYRLKFYYTNNPGVTAAVGVVENSQSSPYVTHNTYLNQTDSPAWSPQQSKDFVVAPHVTGVSIRLFVTSTGYAFFDTITCERISENLRETRKQTYRVECLWDGDSDYGLKADRVFFKPEECTITEAEDSVMLNASGQIYGDVSRIASFTSGGGSYLAFA